MARSQTELVIDKYAELLKHVYAGRGARPFIFERILGDFLREIIGTCVHPRFADTDQCTDEACPNSYRIW